MSYCRAEKGRAGWCGETERDRGKESDVRGERWIGRDGRGNRGEGRETRSSLAWQQKVICLAAQPDTQTHVCLPTMCISLMK